MENIKTTNQIREAMDRNELTYDMGYTSSDQDLMNKGMTLDASQIFKKEKPDNVKRFELLGAEKALLYARKNADYGDSFNVSIDRYGLKAVEIRLRDKFMRFCQLIDNPAQVTEEKIRETLMDMSNYCDMTIMRIDDDEEKEAIAKMKELGEKKSTRPDDSLAALSYSLANATPFINPLALGEPNKTTPYKPYPTCGDEVVKPVTGDGNVYNIHVHTDGKDDAGAIASHILKGLKNLGKVGMLK